MAADKVFADLVAGLVAGLVSDLLATSTCHEVLLHGLVIRFCYTFLVYAFAADFAAFLRRKAPETASPSKVFK